MIIPIKRMFLNAENVLCIEPLDYSFDKIYRSAMGVQWNEGGRFLYHQPPQEWSICRWFRQILTAVKVEYDVDLKLTPQSIFDNIDEDIKSAIFKEATNCP